MKFCLIASKYIGVFIFFSFFIQKTTAQFTVTPSNNQLDPETLVKTVFLGDGVDVSNVTFSGTQSSIGYFVNAQDEVGIDEGLIMSTGLAGNATLPEFGIQSGITSGESTDSDLDPLVDHPLFDLASYEITFTPISDTLRFKYVFASEEYPGFICSNFNDIFGFFISGPNPEGGDYISENIALVPDPADPTGMTFTNDVVSINNVHPETQVCAESYEEYYNENTGSDFLSFGAYLDVFIAQVIVIPCQEYTIKLAISDVGDNIFDSSVFLEAKSFGTGTIAIDSESVSLDGSIAEGCSSSTLSFSLPQPASEEITIPVNIIDCDENAATPGDDFVGFPTEIVFPVGVDTVKYEYFALEDNITEGVEAICFSVQRNPCNLDTFTILIHESPIQNPIISPDTMVCEDELILLQSNLPPEFIVPDPLVFTNSETVQILDDKQSHISEIEVTGVEPEFLKEGMIQSVCIDFLEANIMTDVDLFLQSPSGYFMELSTDNGKDIMPMAGKDTMMNTCFTPYSFTDIENGNPIVGTKYSGNEKYIGDFRPEGQFEDIYDGEKLPSNGTWTLIAIDDDTGGTAVLKGWSITFSALYGLNYSWSSSTKGLLCENCPDYPVVVDQTQTYYLNMTDSYGCATIDSFEAEIIPLLDSTEVFVCDSVSLDFIRLTWNPVVGATGYEISIDNGPFVDIGNVVQFDFTGLNSTQEYTFTIRPLGGICGGRVASTSCITTNCLFEIELITKEDLKCFDDNDGYIEVISNGVFPPYTYTLGGVTNTTGVFDNLSEGTHTVFSSDDSGCMNELEIVILEPKLLIGNFSDVESISCSGINDGTATIEVFGGTGGTTVTWSSGEVGNTASMLSPGWNFVNITDENNCMYDDSILIGDKLPLSATTLMNPASCFTSEDGIGFVNVSGGTGTYSYAWDDPMNQTTKQASNLAPGIYFVTITDGSDCELIVEVTIEGPGPILTQVEGIDITCETEPFGSATCTPSGDNGPFEFEWSSGENGDTANELVLGVNYVTVTDNNMCTTVDSVVINAGGTVVAVLTETNSLSCFGDTDGEISIEISGGSAPYEINYNGLVVTSPVTDLDAGEHCFNIMDDDGCETQQCLTLTEAAAIEVDVVQTNVLCEGAEDGSITLEITGGIEPYTVAWTGPNGYMNDNEDIDDLAAGEYSFLIQDQNLCEISGMVNLTPPNSLDITAVPFNVACKGAATGLINLTIDGGMEPFSFEWEGPNGFTSSDEDIFDLEAGVYILTFEDASGCILTREYEIFEPQSGIVSGISNDDEICFGAENGIASINPTGGTLPYTVLWSNNSPLTSINSLAAGIYTVTITDGSLCELVDSVEVKELEEINLELDQTISSCTDSNDGSASIISITYGGQPADINDFEILWNSFPIQNTPTATGLKGGAEYSVIVTDGLGCTGQSTIAIDNPEPIIIELESMVDIECADGDNGEITVIAQGGAGNYTYEWGQGTNFQNGATAINLSDGTYAVTAFDENGCSGFNQFDIQEPFPISLDYRIFDVLCKGDTTGEIELIANGGQAPYEYLWSNGEVNEEITNLQSGEYHITLLDANGCEQLDTVIVDEPENGILIDANGLDISCFGAEDGRIEIEASGGVGNYIYSLDDLIYNGAVEQIGLRAGLYTVYVKDANGCKDSLVDVPIIEPDEIMVDLGPDLVVDYGSILRLMPTITNSNGIITYDWDSDVSFLLSCLDCDGPFYETTKPGTVTLQITDQNGCVGEDLINISLRDLNIGDVPTAFTPNGDFNNDRLHVFGVEGTRVVSFKVYDRWGEQVYEDYDFEINDTDRGWDGTFNGQEMNTGVYIWIVEVESKLGYIEIFKGNTTLIR